MPLNHKGQGIYIDCWNCQERNRVWRGVFNFICRECGCLCWVWTKEEVDSGRRENMARSPRGGEAAQEVPDEDG